MQLTKHHGLGNDFLVLLDLEERHPIDEDLASAICDRHRGIGADGLIRVTDAGHGRVRMELRNDDGSVGAMSGNGISCLAQAVVRRGLGADGVVEVDTDAGPRTVTVVSSDDPRHHRMRVAMGVPTVGAEQPEWIGSHVLRAVSVDVGNPHLVCQVASADDAPDLERFGRQVNEATPDGVNVELLVADRPDAVHMTVYERGVGPTLACGTGAVATAAAARAWELCARVVTVHQPGGPALVELSEPGADGTAHLTVPVVAVAEISWLG